MELSAINSQANINVAMLDAAGTLSNENKNVMNSATAVRERIASFA